MIFKEEMQIKIEITNKVIDSLPKDSSTELIINKFNELINQHLDELKYQYYQIYKETSYYKNLEKENKESILLYITHEDWIYLGLTIKINTLADILNIKNGLLGHLKSKTHNTPLFQVLNKLTKVNINQDLSARNLRKFRKELTKNALEGLYGEKFKKEIITKTVK